MPSLSQIHRPRLFADVTGQSPVTETLRKEVATGKLGHAFLFCGPRGIGKTTTARILAKALNCESPKEGEPCNVCGPCLSANEGKQLDLIEQDAATHNGVDDMRELIEHVRFAPLGGKRKVYVLDEAHMLTGPAWNALLKTLEEPPAYAFFIFATTEWHKIPATIISRCQRFEFRRIPFDLLSARVKEVAAAEEIAIDEAVVDLIVSRADGCVRDAETLLGQLASVAGKKLTLEIASLVVPQGYGDLASHLVSLWAKRDHTSALRQAQGLADDGVPLVPFFDDLIEVVRRLLIDSGDASKPQSFSPGELNDLALLLFERRRDAKSGVDPLFALQLAGTIAAGGMLKHATRVTPHASQVDMKREASSVKREQDPKAQEKTKAHIEPVKFEPVPPTVTPTPVIPTEEVRRVEGTLSKGIPPLPPVGRNDEGVASPGTGQVIDLNTIRMKWQAIIRAVDEVNHSLPFILKIARPESVRGSTVILRFQYPFHLDKIVTDPKNRSVVQDALSKVLGQSLSIEGIVGEAAQTNEVGAPAAGDIVTNLLNAFGGTVVES